MNDQFKFDVFISHSSKDIPIARDLAERLKNDGLRVWLDEWHIVPGDMIGLKIEKGLETSRTLVLLMSANALTSEWVTLERQTALFRDPNNLQRRFVPVRIDDSEIKDTLRQFAYVDWRQKRPHEYQKLLTACKIPEAVPEFQSDVRLKATLEVKGDSSVWGIAVSPDGTWAASGSRTGSIRLWNLDSGKLLSTIIEERYRVDKVKKFGDEKKVFALANVGIVAAAILRDGRGLMTASLDTSVQVWDIASAKCVKTMNHKASIYGAAATPDGRFAVSGDSDGVVLYWNLESGECIGQLWGHFHAVRGVAITSNGEQAVTGSYDKTIRVWDLKSLACIGLLEGHTAEVWDIAISSDGRFAISASEDCTVRVWDLVAMECIAILEGHTDIVTSVAIKPDGLVGVSGSKDSTIRVWNLKSGQCITSFSGHYGGVYRVVITPDGKKIVSGAGDSALMVWNLPEEHEISAHSSEISRYTNAKIVLVGKTGVGKTGIALRLCNDEWQRTESTHAMSIFQLKLQEDGFQSFEREVWLWDFAGQPDYRLIHQLYMDETALGILVFDPQDDNPFEELGYWVKALKAATKHVAAKILVAARCDRGGITISNRLFEQFCEQHQIAQFISTSAKTGNGCAALKAAIMRHIPWERLPWISTTRLFKLLKDAILQLKEQQIPLIRIQEVRQRLHLMLAGELIPVKDLRAVIGLMQGQGLVQMLGFGDFVLLNPEQINHYASIVVRMARDHADEMGVVNEHDILEGNLDFQGLDRLTEVDEKILLRAMVKMFTSRALCLREQTSEGTILVFPSFFRRDKPDLPDHPNILVTYGFSGTIEEIYSTLVVRLSYSGVFKKDQLWRHAADFRTPVGKRVGISLKQMGEGRAEIVVYFEEGVPEDMRVTFIKYVHEHLLRRAKDVSRIRTYVCPFCNSVVKDREAVQKRLAKGLDDILCINCENRISLQDLIENKFSSNRFLEAVRDLDARAKLRLDKESQELTLMGHVFAITEESGQVFRQLSEPRLGVEAEIEFKTDEGRPSGKKLCLQLGIGDIYLAVTGADRREMLRIRNSEHPRLLAAQVNPVMLILKSISGMIRWMNVTDYLRRNPKALVSDEIPFIAEEFSALNILRLKDRLQRYL